MKAIHWCSALLIAGALFTAPEPVHAQQPPVDHTRPKTPEPVTGELISIDDKTKTLILKTNPDTEMKFSYSEATAIVGGTLGPEGLAKNAGATLTITYDAHGTANVATKIEVHPKK